MRTKKQTIKLCNLVSLAHAIEILGRVVTCDGDLDGELCVAEDGEHGGDAGDDVGDDDGGAGGVADVARHPAAAIVTARFQPTGGIGHHPS